MFESLQRGEADARLETPSTTAGSAMPTGRLIRQKLANCAIGFGLGTIGGRNGRIYVVTSARDDSPANPTPGTLHHAVAKAGPLWIIFSYSMTIRLKNELLVTSYETIDGRGVTVRITGGARDHPPVCE